MEKLKLGWKVYETIGQSYVNPIVYVYDVVRKNKEKGTISEKNISELIKTCFSFAPHRKDRILDIVADNFPQFMNKINTYRILL